MNYERTISISGIATALHSHPLLNEQNLAADLVNSSHLHSSHLVQVRVQMGFGSFVGAVLFSCANDNIRQSSPSRSFGLGTSHDCLQL